MKMSKHKKPSWSFTAHDVEEIDVNRVLRETPADTPWVVIADKFGEPVLLCIREEYLERFTEDDRISVCGTNLQRAWGDTAIPNFGHNNGCLTVPKNAISPGRRVIDGWRVSENDMNSHPMSRDEILRMAEADKYVRRIPVRVYLAGDYHE
jgi:hypothetical protein